MIRNIETLLKNTDLPDFEPGAHRHVLRQRLLCEMEKKSRTTARRKRITLFLALFALAGLSTLAAADVALRKILFREKKEGVYFFQTPREIINQYRNIHEDGSATISGTVKITSYGIPPGPDGTLDIAQTEKDLQEIEYLRQQDNRKILWIFDTEYQGQSWRKFRYMYRLSDGRVWKMNEGQDLPVEMRSLGFREIANRYRAKEGELLPPKEEIVANQSFVFERRKIALSDGKEVIYAVGAPKERALEQAIIQRDLESVTGDSNAQNALHP